MSLRADVKRNVPLQKKRQNNNSALVKCGCQGNSSLISIWIPPERTEATTSIILTFVCVWKVCCPHCYTWRTDVCISIQLVRTHKREWHEKWLLSWYQQVRFSTSIRLEFSLFSVILHTTAVSSTNLVVATWSYVYWDNSEGLKTPQPWSVMLSMRVDKVCLPLWLSPPAVCLSGSQDSTCTEWCLISGPSAL